MLALDAAVLTPAAAIIIALLGGGGLYALLKVRPEAAQISVNAAQGAVVVQTGVIDSLKSEIARQDQELLALRVRVTELSRTAATIDELTDRIDRLEIERDRYRNEASTLRKRVKALEGELAEIKNGHQ